MRRIITSSEEDDCLIVKPDAPGGNGKSKPLLTLEAGRLPDKLRSHLRGMEMERARCSNIKGEVSGKMKRNIKDALIIADEIEERLNRQSGSLFSRAEAVIQLRTEARLKDEKIRQMEEEIARLKKELKKREAEKQSQGVKAVAAPNQGKQVLPTASRVTPALEKRLEEARAGDREGNVMAMLREVNKSIEALQRNQMELWNAFTGTGRSSQRGTDVVEKTAKGGEGSAPAPGTSRAPAPRIPAAPPQDGFIEVVGKRKRSQQTERTATTTKEPARKVEEKSRGERSATGNGTEEKKKKRKAAAVEPERLQRSHWYVKSRGRTGMLLPRPGRTLAFKESELKQ
ncbi:hypothetical protein M0804_013172 [Polistes exclamans]|nr:hypothetical protein M0804_013172 [Polistes exclamans]